LPERERKRWKRLAEQQGVVYAKTAAEAMKLNVDMDNPADREKLRPAVLELVAGRIARSIPLPALLPMKITRKLRVGHNTSTEVHV
jgi:hypothetical protein